LNHRDGPPAVRPAVSGRRSRAAGREMPAPSSGLVSLDRMLAMFCDRLLCDR
jgi:hypothetical protein